MDTKEKIMVEMRATDQTVNELKNVLTPEQIAKFLLLSDKVSELSSIWSRPARRLTVLSCNLFTLGEIEIRI